MILHLVKCEMCDKQFEFNPMERFAEQSAPEGWLMLSRMKDTQTSLWHFCGSACLRIWLANNYPIEPVSESPFIRREEVPA